jgi:cytochrome c-type biogenesis protein CcmH
MTGFLVSAALLLAVGVSFLLWPLLRNRTKGGERDRAVVALYRDQLRELNADRASGAVSEEQFEGGRRELERRLLDEIAQPAPLPRVARSTGLTAAAVSVFVIALPIGMYLTLGRPDAIGPMASESQAADQGQGASGGEKAAHPITPAQVQVMIDQLAKALEQNPGDGEGWAMLARSYVYLRNFPEAAKAFKKATQLRPHDARLFSDYADALAMTQEKGLVGEPMKLVQHALSIDPKEVKALALAGSEAFNRKDYAAAVSYWDRAVKAQPSDQQFAAQLQANLMEARALAGGSAPPQTAAAAAPAPAAAQSDRRGAMAGAEAPSGATVKGRVELSTSLVGKAAPNDTVFVFARAAQGPRMPLALMRRTVKDLPLEFALDDSMAMMPNLKLSNFSSVVIGARVSKAGDAMPASGDLQGFSQPVKVGSAGVDVRIDQVVP